MNKKYNIKSIELKSLRKTCYVIEQSLLKGKIGDAIILCNRMIGDIKTLKNIIKQWKN